MLRKSLPSEDRSESSRSSSSPPRSTPKDIGFNHIIPAKFDLVHTSVEQELDAMSSSFISKFSSMLNHFRLGLNPLIFFRRLMESGLA